MFLLDWNLVIWRSERLYLVPHQDLKPALDFFSCTKRKEHGKKERCRIGDGALLSAMLVMPFLAYSLLVLVPYSTVKLESQEEGCISIANTPLMVEHREERQLVKLEKEM